MARTDKVGAHKTSIYHTDYGDTVVQYHNTRLLGSMLMRLFLIQEVGRQ